MINSSKKSPSFKKEGLEISTPYTNLPFMFSVHFQGDTRTSASSSDRKENEANVKSQKLKLSFKHELQKLGVSAKLIPEKNPLKEAKDPNKSPTTGLPFQRRCRSNSPPKEELKMTEKNNGVLFAPRSPVVGSHKMNLKEDFSGFCKDTRYSLVEEDEDLRKLKEEYRRMLEGASSEYFCSDSEEIADEGEADEIENQVGVNKRRYFK